MDGKTIAFAAACCVAGVLQAAPLNEKEAKIVKSRLIPAPRSIVLTDGPDVVLGGTVGVTLACAKDGPAASQEVGRLFKEWFGIAPKLASGDAGRAPRPADAYRITASNGSLAIEAADLGGARNAMRTLRQIAEPVRGTRELKAYFVP